MDRKKHSANMATMKFLVVVSVFVGLMVTVCAVNDTQFNDLKAFVEKQAANQKKMLVALARQVNAQQLYVEEVARSHGDSGIKMTRLARTGSKPYNSDSFTGSKLAAAHDHSNYKNTVGLGEIIAVLNGVEFRTRHNDYKLDMPSRTNTTYHMTDEIPMPDLPQAVKDKPTLAGKITELREWFKAFKNQDYSRRDYRPYFKANLCYLEGAWTVATSGSIDEPFESARHAIDAKNFADLQEKIMYTSATGRKSTLENFAYLPTTISNVTDDGEITYSQWNYRILCHPLKTEVPLSRFRIVDDLAARVTNGKTLEDHANTRAARFTMYQDPTDSPLYDKRESIVKLAKGTFLDKLMEEIPGKDNYKGDIVDDGFDTPVYKVDADLSTNPLPDPINAAYYHNVHKTQEADAMGVSIRRRGFSDSGVYIAYNTQPKITPVSVEGSCDKKTSCHKKHDNIVKKCEEQGICRVEPPVCPELKCKRWTHRVSYAIPLEIVYTTPLNAWNPYDLPLRDEFRDVSYGSRNGQNSNEKAYNGTANDKFFYRTPIEFFEDTEARKEDAADTVATGAVYVMKDNGDIKAVAASGISIITKPIPGVGTVRTRYPIMPIHDEGNTVYRDMLALSDMSLKKNKYLRIYPSVKEVNGTIEEYYGFEMGVSASDYVSPHVHTFELTKTEIDDILYKEGLIEVTTSTVAGHEHNVLVWYNHKQERVMIKKCDTVSNKKSCWDKHPFAVVCPECPFDLKPSMD